MSGTFHLARPGAFSGLYAQCEPRSQGLRQVLSHLGRQLSLRPGCAARRHAGFVRRVRDEQARLAQAGRAADPASLRRLMAGERCGTRELAHVFAAVGHVFAHRLGKAPYDMQIAAARCLLDGGLSEMPTGEGKTLAAALAACVAALAGTPVHVLTANDYLVSRDAQWLEPACEALGLRVGHVTASASPQERRAAYGCDIAYGTARELVFDYLRDGLQIGACGDLELRIAHLLGGTQRTGAPALRGLYFAIVDEADSILLDEARTPLILARTAQRAHARVLRCAMQGAQGLQEGRDYTLETQLHQAQLTPQGEGRALATDWPDAGHGDAMSDDPRHRVELVELALAALHLYARDRDYLVRDGSVQIVDALTGRVAEGRAWSRGLHQLIELKEGLEPSGEQETLARLTYQRFFPRYHRLAGLSGTLAESARELGADYGLATWRVPERTPSRRRMAGVRLYRRAKDKWRAVVAEIRQLHAQGRPVLVGTASVEESEFLGSLMARLQLPHVVLNARQDADEAALVAAAGQPGRITIATNMAGRGTDIALSPAARKLGGLHVLAAHVNESARIDRQLWGRCARQGDPGSVGVVASLEDPVFRRELPAWLQACLSQGSAGAALPGWLSRLLVATVQRRAEWHARRARRELRQHDDQMDQRLPSGSAE